MNTCALVMIQVSCDSFISHAFDSLRQICIHIYLHMSSIYKYTSVCACLYVSVLIYICLCVCMCIFQSFIIEQRIFNPLKSLLSRCLNVPNSKSVKAAAAALRNEISVFLSGPVLI